jgi:hypothetical protein
MTEPSDLELDETSILKPWSATELAEMVAVGIAEADSGDLIPLEEVTVDSIRARAAANATKRNG